MTTRTCERCGRKHDAKHWTLPGRPPHKLWCLPCLRHQSHSDATTHNDPAKCHKCQASGDYPSTKEGGAR